MRGSRVNEVGESAHKPPQHKGASCYSVQNSAFHTISSDVAIKCSMK